MNKPKPKPKEEPPKEKKDAEMPNDTVDQSAGNGDMKDAKEATAGKDEKADQLTADKDKESKAEMELDWPCHSSVMSCRST